MQDTGRVSEEEPVRHETQGMLRVLHVLDSLQIGGTEWQCLSLVGRLDRRRYRNAFVCFNSGGPLLETLRSAGVASLVLPFRGFRRPAGLKDLLRLAGYMRQHHIHIVQAYGFYSNVPGILAGRMARVPILVASRRDMGEFLTSTHRVVERAIFHLADHIVVNASAIKDDLVRVGQAREEKITEIPSGVDLDRFYPPDLREADNPPPPWAGKGKVVAMVAKFREQKDHSTFLRAARRILSIDPTVVFVLAGGAVSGSPVCERLEEEAKELAMELKISSAIWFLGPIDPRRIPALLQHVDISVLASNGNEGTPNVILEAMAAAKPVVATDTGGCREAVIEGVSGFLVPTGDAEQLAEKILRLLRDDTEAHRMGKAGRRRVESEFSLARMCDRFSALYEHLAQKRLGLGPRVE